METPDGSTLRALIDLRDRTLQKSRIAFSNRALAIERGADTAEPATAELVSRWMQRFAELEDQADADIREIVADMPIVAEMIKIKGLGPMLAAKVVSMIDIERADTVSALWRYCGYGVKVQRYVLACGHSVESLERAPVCPVCGNIATLVSTLGERERPTRGEKLHYNSRLKSTLYLVGTSFLKCGSPYRTIYDDARARYADTVHALDCRMCSAKAGEPLRPGHQHARAMRVMIKVWLQHLWLTWRKLEGLPTNSPYAIGVGGHAHYLSPEEFGWQVSLTGSSDVVANVKENP